jgi:hypothetical protein
MMNLLRFWFADPNYPDHASGRKIRIYVWTAMVPFIVLGSLAGTVSLEMAIALLAVGGGEALNYSINSPSKDNHK